jgi:hypothetical protein
MLDFPIFFSPKLVLVLRDVSSSHSHEIYYFEKRVTDSLSYEMVHGGISLGN